MMARTEDIPSRALPSSSRSEYPPRGKAPPTSATTLEKEERARLATDCTSEGEESFWLSALRLGVGATRSGSGKAAASGCASADWRGSLWALAREASAALSELLLAARDGKVGADPGPVEPVDALYTVRDLLAGGVGT